MKKMLITAVLWVVFFFPAYLGAAENLSVAVAANFMLPFQEIARAFEAQSAIKTTATFSSTGKLYGQIIAGAPYDVFLSADEERPAQLAKDGQAQAPFIYARGRVVLWSASRALCAAADWKAMLASADVRRIAIANPETAPYGAMARAALRQTGLWTGIQPRLVFPQDIMQAFQYASTQAVDAAFCARSAVFSALGRKGCWKEVPEAGPVIQSACILKRSAHNAAAKRLAAFLVSDKARRIKEKYGYQ